MFGKPDDVTAQRPGDEDETVVMSLADDASAAPVSSIVEEKIVDQTIVASTRADDPASDTTDGMSTSSDGAGEPVELTARDLELASSELAEDQTTTSGSPGTTGGRAFGLGDAIHLMRSLPLDEHNADALIRVVRLTLGQVNVQVDDLIADAVNREQDLRDRLSRVQAEVEGLRARLEERDRALAQVETDLREVVAVRERLLVNAPVSIAVPRRPPPPPRMAVRKLRTRTQKIQRSQRKRPG